MIIDQAQANMTQSHSILNTSDMKNKKKKIFFELEGEIHHYINQNLHPITKLLIDYLLDALPKMHNSFIQPMK